MSFSRDSDCQIFEGDCLLVLARINRFLLNGTLVRNLLIGSVLPTYSMDQENACKSSKHTPVAAR